MSVPSPRRPTPPTGRGRRPKPGPRRGPLAIWRALDGSQQRTAAAVVLLLVTFVAPWYARTTVTRSPADGDLRRSGDSLSALAAFSFVEAAIVLVAVAVLALLWGRATRRGFSLPFGDGALVAAAGGWTGLLILFRLFDRPPGVRTARVDMVVGDAWGIFAGLLAAALLAASGLDQRRRSPARHLAARRARDGRDADTVVVDPDTVVRAPTAERARPRADVSPSWAVPEVRADPPRTARRRPAGSEDPTRALGREDATRVLREEGVPPATPPTIPPATPPTGPSGATSTPRYVPPEPGSDEPSPEPPPGE